MPLQRWLVQLGVVLLIGCTMTAPLVWAKSKKPKKAGRGGPSEAAGQRLLEKSDGVQNCAATHGLDHGAKEVEIDTTITINSSGQVVNILTKVTVDKAERALPVKECVDALLKGIKFPAIPAPLTTIQRTWTIATS